jgi:hypothetical protein
MMPRCLLFFPLLSFWYFSVLCNEIDVILPDNDDLSEQTLLSPHSNSGSLQNASLFVMDAKIQLRKPEIVLPPIFVLNLDRSQSRWRTIQQVMTDAGLTVERLPGVDGRKLSKSDLQQNSTWLARSLQPRGVIGK